MAECTCRTPDLHHAEATRLSNIAAGEALRVGDVVTGRGFPNSPGTVVSVGGGTIRVDQPGIGIVPWTVLDAGRELTVQEAHRG